MSMIESKPLRVRACLFVLCLASCVALAAEKPELGDGVRQGSYMKWHNSLYLEGDDVNSVAIVVPAIGGRITFYGYGTDNIIYENPASAGKLLATSPEGFVAGGYQCDLGPEIRGIPEHRNLWTGPWSWSADKDHSVTVTSDPDPVTGMQLEKTMTLDAETGEMGLTQRMKNISDQEKSYCLWDRTLCKGGGFAFFPLKKKSRFPAKWSVRRSVDGKYSYDGVKPAADNVKVLDGVLVARTVGEATKVGADSDAGWIAYTRGKLLFVKYFPYDSKGNYSDGGNSVELYFDRAVAELEPLSPEVALKPGESYSFPEKWVLIQLKEEVTTFEQARALVKRVPPFKF